MQLATKQKRNKWQVAAIQGPSIYTYYLVLVEACELLFGDILVKSHACSYGSAL